MASKTKKKSTKLTKKDIGGSKNNILHSINHIRANENKVIAILTVIFIVIFGVVGYFTLTVDSSSLLSNISKSADITGVSVSTRVVTLDSEDVMSDEEGLKSLPITVSIHNGLEDLYSYQLSLKYDEFIKKACECEKSIDKNYIHYSVDGINVKTLNDDMILDVNSVEESTGKDINIRIWVSNEINLDDETHFHGRFNVESCSIKENN